MAKTLLVSCAIMAALAGCAGGERNDSAREWQRAECNRVIDKEDRDRCLRRVEDDHSPRRIEWERERRK